MFRVISTLDEKECGSYIRNLRSFQPCPNVDMGIWVSVIILIVTTVVIQGYFHIHPTDNKKLIFLSLQLVQEVLHQIGFKECKNNRETIGHIMNLPYPMNVSLMRLERICKLNFSEPQNPSFW